MDAPHTPFPQGWFCAGPGPLWGVERTYACVPYAILPQLPRTSYDSSFAWLAPAAVRGAGLHYDRNPDESTAGIETLPALMAEAESLGLALPPSFVRFVSDSDLYDRVWSGTDCYLDFSHGLVEDPVGGNSRMLRFMNDSQACVLWYLYLSATGGHCVLASGEWHFGFRDEARTSLDPQRYFWCAPCFEQFLHRFWLENLIWKRVRYGETPTPDEARYLQAAVEARPRLREMGLLAPPETA